ncbi:MAG: PDZ domain-containing protein [Thermodesulfobacteriota bacterium]
MRGGCRLRCYCLLISVLLLAVNGCSLTTVSDGGEGESGYNPLFFPPFEAPEEEGSSPFLGISMGTAGEGSANEAAGITVEYVIEGSEAERAGLIAGDTIIAIDGKPFGKEGDRPHERLQEAVKERGVGGRMGLTLLRGGEELEVEAEVGERRRAPATVREHSEIDDIQRGLAASPSPLYRSLEGEGKSDGFRETLIQLHLKSRLADSYRVSPENPFRLGEINYLLRNPTNIIPLSRGITRSLLDGSDDRLEVDRLIGEAAGRLDADFTPEGGGAPSLKSVSDLVEYIVGVAARVESYREAALKGLTPDEAGFLRENALEALSDEVEEVESGDDEALLRLLRIVRKIDYPMLFASAAEAARLVSPAVTEALEVMDVEALKRNPSIPGDAGSGDIIDVIESRFGRGVIGGTGTARYRGDTSVIIDFGGDDLYEGGAGASTGGYPMSVVIDLAGNDRYIAREHLSHGAALLGTGIVMDRRGDDTYLSGRFSQGCGILGTGLLLDREGDDRYVTASYGEGAAIFGIGMVIDGGGDDTYEAHRLSQGYASVRGFGALVDREGDDYYSAGGRYPDHRDPEYATQSLSQGFAIGLRPYRSSVGAPGGIGVLVDGRGNDTYVGDYFSQGSSYWYSLGILHDLAGDDRYIAGRYAQGAGVHVSAGALIDERGDDTYMVTYGVAQGAGHDFGIGVLADFSGDDSYRGGDLSQGAATCGSIGVLYDRDGLNNFFDDYEGREKGEENGSCGSRGFGLHLSNDGEKDVESER